MSKAGTARGGYLNRSLTPFMKGVAALIILMALFSWLETRGAHRHQHALFDKGREPDVHTDSVSASGAGFQFQSLHDKIDQLTHTFESAGMASARPDSSDCDRERLSRTDLARATSACPAPTHTRGGERAKRLGVVVPFRDRDAHLQIFSAYMYHYLCSRGIDFRIFVAEQLGTQPFNRGWLINAGVLAAGNDTDYIATHDVDMLPIGEVPYGYPGRDEYLHLASEATQFESKLPYPRYCGGVFVVSRELYMRFNGFSNNYWGWGGEDDEFCTRLMVVKYGAWDENRFGSRQPLPRPPPGAGRFISLSDLHTSRENRGHQKNIDRLARFEANPRTDLIQLDGVGSAGELREILASREEHATYTHLKFRLPVHLQPT